MANDEVANFDTMRDMVLNTTEKGPIDPKTNKEFDPTRQIQSKDRFQFKWDTKTKDIVTTHISRSIRSTINENEQLMGQTHYHLGGQIKQGVLLTNPAFDKYKWPCLFF